MSHGSKTKQDGNIPSASGDDDVSAGEEVELSSGLSAGGEASSAAGGLLS